MGADNLRDEKSATLPDRLVRNRGVVSRGVLSTCSGAGDCRRNRRFISSIASCVGLGLVLGLGLIRLVRGVLRTGLLFPVVRIEVEMGEPLRPPVCSLDGLGIEWSVEGTGLAIGESGNRGCGDATSLTCVMSLFRMPSRPCNSSTTGVPSRTGESSS